RGVEEALHLIAGGDRAAPVGTGGTAAQAVRVLDVVHAGEQRPDAGVVLRLRRGERDRAIGAAVKRAAEGDDLGAPGGLAGQLERTLDGLGAAVAEEDGV